MESLSFKEFDNPKFPVKSSYPETARYYETTKKKYSYQVFLRERKEKYVRMLREEYEKYRKYGGGTLKSVFPKLVVKIQKVYVPAYQTADRKAYFMDLQGLLKLHGVKHWIYAFSGTIES
ncbi:hypothetical protein GF319_03890, partial [Candidatus Bathyarchaeota archaeon]|nr:hypothetical protein [Candidatus Bathyarchaeota archaeon]